MLTVLVSQPRGAFYLEDYNNPGCDFFSLYSRLITLFITSYNNLHSESS